MELLRLHGATVDEGDLKTADAIRHYVDRVHAERGGAQGQGQEEEEEENNDHD